jgi:hypothetical protein
MHGLSAQSSFRIDEPRTTISEMRALGLIVVLV